MSQRLNDSQEYIYIAPPDDAYAIDQFLKERTRQDEKWNQQWHSPVLWLLILVEEVGEVAKALLRWKFGGAPLKEYHDEMVQCGAVALAAIGNLKRDALMDKVSDPATVTHTNTELW